MLFYCTNAEGRRKIVGLFTICSSINAEGRRKITNAEGRRKITNAEGRPLLLVIPFLLGIYWARVMSAVCTILSGSSLIHALVLAQG